MRTILKILIMLVGVFSYAQTTVSGSITDQNNQPLSGATVIVVGTSSGVAADFDGNYTITVDMDAPFSIEASSVGFKPATVEVTGSSTVNIVLEDSLNNYPNMILDYSQLGNVKLGSFSQLDVRFDKKWNKENVSINFFLEILNLLAQKIPSPTEYGLERDNYGNILTPYNLIEVDVNRESIIPSFGFSIDF